MELLSTLPLSLQLIAQWPEADKQALMRRNQIAKPTFKLVQEKQSKLLAACGFPCEFAGEKEFNGQTVRMFKPTGEKRAAVAGLIGYGGGAFGGKTYGNLVTADVLAQLWPGVKVGFFRRTYPELEGPDGAISKAYEVFAGSATPKEGGREWHWPNGSRLYFLHCQHEKDVYSYQGGGMDVVIIDEATHFTWFIVDYFLTRNRATSDNYGFRPFAILTANPGNIGHAWYCQVFDMENKLGQHEMVKTTTNPNEKREQVYFIPALLEDNRIGTIRDPDYESRLMRRDELVARALRRGDWSIFAGQAFMGWTKERVACPEFDIPETWPRWRAIDYGFDHPFTCGWFTMNPKSGRVYIYRAVLEGNLSDTQQARLIRTMTSPDERIAITYASPDMWARKSAGEKVFTSVDEYRDEGVPLVRADNDRKSGKRKIDRLLAEEMADGKPGIQVFEPYFDVFRCMSTLVRAKDQSEDVEKVNGDDAYDMLRYGLTNTNPPERKSREEIEQARRTNKNPLKGNRML